MTHRIYVASSWRNPIQPLVVKALREEGHEVYDFRNPKPGNHGFSWSEIDKDWEGWTPEKHRRMLWHPIAVAAFRLDAQAMHWADTCVLVLPCGRSAHLEGGLCAGMGRRLWILLTERCEPELMYKRADGICLSMEELIGALRM